MDQTHSRLFYGSRFLLLILLNPKKIDQNTWKVLKMKKDSIIHGTCEYDIDTICRSVSVSQVCLRKKPKMPWWLTWTCTDRHVVIRTNEVRCNVITNLILFIFTFTTQEYKVKNNINLKPAVVKLKGKPSFSVILLGLHYKLICKILWNTAMLKKDLVLFIFMLFCYSSHLLQLWIKMCCLTFLHLFFNLLCIWCMCVCVRVYMHVCAHIVVIGGGGYCCCF